MERRKELEMSRLDEEERPPTVKQPASFGVLHLLVAISVLAVFSAALFHENEWWRAILGTSTSMLILNSIFASIFARGEQRAFALSYFIGAVFCPIMAYSYMVSLPFLITQKLEEFIQNLTAGEFNTQNFYTIALLFWINVTCITSGYMGRAWYRRNVRTNEQQPINASPQ